MEMSINVGKCMNDVETNTQSKLIYLTIAHNNGRKSEKMIRT